MPVNGQWEPARSATVARPMSKTQGQLFTRRGNSIRHVVCVIIHPTGVGGGAPHATARGGGGGCVESHTIRHARQPRPVMEGRLGSTGKVAEGIFAQW